MKDNSFSKFHYIKKRKENKKAYPSHIPLTVDEVNCVLFGV